MSVALYSYDKLLNGLNYYNRHNWYNNDDGGGGGGDGDSSGDHEVYVKYVKACYWQCMCQFTGIFVHNIYWSSCCCFYDRSC